MKLSEKWRNAAILHAQMRARERELKKIKKKGIEVSSIDVV